MAIKQRERMLIGGALLCMGLYAADVFGVEPLMATWKANETAIVKRTKDISQGNAVIKNEKTLRQAWTDMQSRSLPIDQGAASTVVINAVGNWAIASRLNVTGIKSRWTMDETIKNSRDNKNDRLEVRISAEGNLVSVTRFLYEMEHDKLAVRGADVEIRSRDDHGTQLLLDVRFTALILPEEKSK